MTSTPRVSVVIPVYNRERFVAEAVESALDQSWRPLEVVVVDDGSTDRSPEILAGFGAAIRVHRQPNRGVAAARNAGIQRARGDFVVHFDSDDILPSDSVALRARAILADPTLDAVAGHVDSFLDPGLSAEDRRRFAAPESPRPGMAIGAMMVTRGLIERVGPLDESFRSSAGMDWLMRARESGMRVAMLPDVVLRRRIHGDNLGAVRGDSAGDRLRVLKAALDRRRAGHTNDERPA